MAEMDRDLYGATDPEGKRLAPNCHCILGLLWSNVDYDDAKRYRREQGATRRAPRVKASLLGPIGRLLQLSEDYVRRLVHDLKEACYVQPDPRDPRYLALLDQPHRDALLAAKLLSALGVKGEIGDDLGRSSGVIPDDQPGSSGRSAGIFRTISRDLPDDQPDDPLKVPSLRSQLKGPECRSQARTSHSSDSRNSNLEIALGLVRDAVPPEGAAPLPATARGVKPLVALLDESEDMATVVATVKAVLEHAPALVANDYENADWYGPFMFAGPWAGWTKALAKWRAHQAATERARQQRPREASPATVAREALERLVSAIESPPRLTDVDVIGWELLDPSSAAARFRPAAAAAVLAELRAAGELDLAELRAELSKLEVTAQHVQARLIGDVVASARVSVGRREAPRSHADEEANEHTTLMRRRDEVKRQCEQQLAQERDREAAESRRGGLL